MNMNNKDKIDILRDNIDRRRHLIPENEYYLAECDKWQAEIDDILQKVSREEAQKIFNGINLKGIIDPN